MKNPRLTWLVPLMFALGATGCGDDPLSGEGEAEAEAEAEAEGEDGGGMDDGAVVGCTTTEDVSANIDANTTWTADTCYNLTEAIFVSDATLTIEAGTKITGESGSSLVVAATGRLVADGTATDPIVFTSAVAVGSRQSGDWGGVVMLGLSTINVTGGTNKIEGFAATTPGIDYGGTDDTHDCGIVRYVRIEFAGFELSPNNELNGLTMGGCGSDTVVDYVQVHKGKDDGVEVFGGAVDIKHVLITQPTDDGLDWDFGWVGRGQFIVVQQNTLVGNAGIEADNNNSDNDAAPRSDPLLYNLTLVGSDADPGLAGMTQLAMVLRRGTAGQIYNALLRDFADYPVDVGGTNSAAQATGGGLFIKNSIFYDNANSATWPTEATDNDGAFDEAAFFVTGEATNRINVDADNVLPNNLQAPDFRLSAGSPALTGAATPPGDGFFDTAATYVGAFDDSTDWTAGWASFPQN